jgi:DNA repair photolyase
MRNIIDENKREFVSFGGLCPYNCLHCYTFLKKYNINIDLNTVDDIIHNINQNESFDIFYVSGNKENFIDPDKGIELCERLFNKFETDILLTTRNVFTDTQIRRLSNLNNQMKKYSKCLFVCISIPALNSHTKLEQNPLVPNPKKRIDFLKSVYNESIFSILTIRPLCPNDFISIEEPLEIIRLCKDSVSAVISSGIFIDDDIIKRLKSFPKTYNYLTKPLMKCLKNTDCNMKYVDVEYEIKLLEKQCLEFTIPFYTKSVPALNYLKNMHLK